MMKEKIIHSATPKQLKEAAQWRRQATRTQKSAASESLGESYADQVSTKQHGMKPVLTGADKGTNHFFDAAYIDKEGRMVVVEAKGQGSRMSPAQKDSKWLAETSQKVQRGAPGYQKASRQEKWIAKEVQERLQRGEAVGLIESRTRMGTKLATTSKVKYFGLQETGTKGGPVTTKPLDNLQEASQVAGKKTGTSQPPKAAPPSRAVSAASKVGSKGTPAGKAATPARTAPAPSPGSLIGRFFRSGGKL